MRAANLRWTAEEGWTTSGEILGPIGFVLFFGERKILESGDRFNDLKSKFPGAIVAGCSSGGQIMGDDVSDDSVVAVAMAFERTSVRLAVTHAGDNESFSHGRQLGAHLLDPALRHVFLIANGTHTNGSALVRGLVSAIGDGPTISGGLAGDGARFEKTLVCADAAPSEACIAAIGFYGDALVIGNGSFGGWDEFGPNRKVTRSIGNVVYELDGEPVLDLYKRYLGQEAEGLPGSGLLYPLSIVDPASPTHRVVRTILGINEIDKSMTFAGDVPTGFTAQLMQGRFDRLADAAGAASRRAFSQHVDRHGDIAAVYVSCVGRRILMGQNIIDETIAAQSAALPDSKSIGFYSYGEICPDNETGTCELHNQTMAVTTFSERA